MARARTAARWAGIAAGLIGLNLAAIAASPVWNRSEKHPPPRLWCDPTQFQDDAGNYVVAGVKSRPMIRSGDGRVDRPATQDDYPLPLHQGDRKSRVLDTVMYRPDGSIIRYNGNPGMIEQIFTRPRVLQPSARPFLAVWWPFVGSVFISLAVFVILLRQARSQFHDPGLEGDASGEHRAAR